MAEKIHNFFPFHIEKELMEAFLPEAFIELGLTRYYPRVYRGLPRIYLRDNPLKSQIKQNFTHMASLKKQAASKALYSLYGKMAVRGKVTLLTWVMDDGMGDYIAAVVAMRLIKARLPDVDVRMVSLIPEKMAKLIEPSASSVMIVYKGEVPCVSVEGFLLLAESDLVLQLPTFYPYTRELQEALPHVTWEMVGEYGFIESGWFHPNSEKFSLGLHFLEKGILTRKPCSASWDDVQNVPLMQWRDAKNHFYLAYLATQVGGAIYLHALLKSLENDPKDIDLCSPDLGWFIAFYEEQTKLGKSLIEWDVGVGKIEIRFQDKVSFLNVGKGKKTLRLLCPGAISESDFRALVVLSGEWVAVRGNQSFSEVISQRKAFFYDGREHARFFIKDLGAIASNRIRAYPATLDCIRGMLQGFLYNVSTQEETWVDETHFQELENWTTIALKIGMALQDPNAVEGFKQLGTIIAEEFSANTFLCHLVQRALFHKQHPYVKELEAVGMDRFTSDEIGFKQLIQEQKELLGRV